MADEAKPVVVETTPVVPVTPAVPAKKGGKGCLWLVLGCGALLLLCCCISTIIAVVAPNAAVKFLAGANTGPDSSLTRVTVEEGQAIDATLNDDLYSGSTSTGDQTTVFISEKQLLVLLNEGLKLEENVDQIAAKIEPGKLTIQVGIEALIRAQENRNQDVTTTPVPTGSYEFLKDVYVTVKISSSADQKSLIVDDVLTGNSIIDGLIPAEYKTQLKTQVQEALNNYFAGDTTTSDFVVDKIEFKQDVMEITTSLAQ